MMVERFLQVRGWQQGWTFYLRLSRAPARRRLAGFGSSRAGGRSGRFSIGLTIDFLAGIEPSLIPYGKPVMIFPAQIGRLAGSNAPELACDFVGFVLSDAGQRLLLQPGVGRVPALASVRDEAGEAIQAMRNAIRRAWQTYDAGLAEQRYWAVNALFDIFISDRLPQRRSCGRGCARCKAARPAMNWPGSSAC